MFSWSIALARGGHDAYVLASPHFSGNAPSTLYRSADDGSTWQIMRQPCRSAGGYRTLAITAGSARRAGLLCTVPGKPAGFVAVILVPFIKYPANPPSVGDAETIGKRTILYFIMTAVSVVAMFNAVVTTRKLSHRLGLWNGAVIAGLAYLVLVGIVQERVWRKVQRADVVEIVHTVRVGIGQDRIGRERPRETGRIPRTRLDFLHVGETVHIVIG